MDKNITLAGYTNYFLWLELPNIRAVLRRKAESGCTVRFLIGDPDSETTRHREQVRTSRSRSPPASASPLTNWPSSGTYPASRPGSATAT